MAELTPQQEAEIAAKPCHMLQREPYDFAWCETHDTTFPLGSVCMYYAIDAERESRRQT